VDIGTDSNLQSGKMAVDKEDESSDDEKTMELTADETTFFKRFKDSTILANNAIVIGK
jgi:hypothetical protein